MIYIIIPILILFVVIWFLGLPGFGALPRGKRLKRIKNSPNYRKGKFQNLSHTPMMTKDANFFKIMWNFLFSRQKTDPENPLPIIRSELKNPPANKTVITWFGHSSYLIQSHGKNILVDPLFSQRTSPVQWAGTKAFPGTDAYGADDLPALDLVIITHDHYDHLDHETILKIKSKSAQFITTLGVGAHLERWGIASEKIYEMDWYDEKFSGDNLKLICLPARHFSGRNMYGRYMSLWASFALHINDERIFIGGDSGYENHFKTIGEKYGPFDLALLECGQYNKFWPYIHMNPEETARAAKDLNANYLMPVHWGKFRLSTHYWTEPANRVTAKAIEINQKITTPKIGEQVILHEKYPAAHWWEKV